jgi:t-SNARE complex subunit (syntaxin)
MAVDLIAIVKALWGFATFVLLGVLKITYSDYKKMQERQDNLEKDIIRMKADMVTKDSLDEIFDRKMKHLQESLQDMRSESRSETNALRTDMQRLINIMMENQRR